MDRVLRSMAVFWLLSGMSFGIVTGEQFSVEVIQPSISVEVVTPPVAEASPPCIVVAYTTAICGPCNRWKATEKDKLIAAGVQVEYVDANKLKPGWASWLDKARRDYNMPIDTVPHFFVLSSKDRTLMCPPLSGFKSAMHLISVGTRRNFMAPAQKQAVTYEMHEEPRMSHSDLVSLHNSLHGGGSWTWPGDLATHLQQSHGVSTAGTSGRIFNRRNTYSGGMRRSSQPFCPTCPVR